MFAIKNRWPSKHPERIQLYSLNTPNGIKVALALEEMQLAYEAHTVDITQGDQHTAEYKALNFNNKIPSIIDRKSTRLNSSHVRISYAVFCLKKKKKKTKKKKYK